MRKGPRDGEVEVVVGEWEAAPAGMLEGDPALRIEADAGGRLPDRRLVAIDAADPRPRELAGEEEGPLAIATAEVEHPLGRAVDVQCRGGERDQVGGGHAAIIAS